jgi:hypothetical protein
MWVKTKCATLAALQGWTEKTGKQFHETKASPVEHIPPVAIMQGGPQRYRRLPACQAAFEYTGKAKARLTLALVL